MSTTNDSKISIIVPIYNAAQYLAECLDSILSQSLSEIEVICVNDGSTDSSLSILNKYALTDKRIIIISQDNQGVAVARNVAMRHANGKYIAFVDPDDLYPDSSVLASLYAIAENNKCMIVGGEFEKLLPDGSINQNFSANYVGYLFKNSGLIEYKDYQYDYGFQRFLFNREMLINNNIFFPLFRRYQDPPFLVKAMYCAKYFYAISKPTYRYRVGHKKIDWTANNCQKVVDFINGVCYELDYALKNNLHILQDLILKRIIGTPSSLQIITENCNNAQVQCAAKKMIQLLECVNKDFVTEKLANTQLDSIITYSNSLLPGNISSNSNIKVSIIVPVYNVEKYLSECLDSLINQTLKEIEIICVNDCSTDNSAKILEAYSKRDSRIKSIHLTKNGGLSNARNTALQHIKGEYVFFIDSDDFIELDALEKLLNIAVSHDIDQILFQFSVKMEGEFSHMSKNYDIEYPEPLTQRIYSGTYLFSRLDELKLFYASVCCKFTKNELIKSNNITFINGYIHEDNYFSVKTILHAKRVIATNDKYYIRRLRDNSIMTAVGSDAVFKHICGYAANVAVLQTEIRNGMYTQKQQNLIHTFCGKMILSITCYLKKLNDTEKEKVMELLKQGPGNENWSLIISSGVSIFNKPNKELQKIHNSYSYKLGLFITWLPRKLYNFISCIKQNGLYCTYKRYAKLVKKK